MEITELERLLRQGSGRAVLRLQETADCTPYRDIILHACTHNMALDRQCESSRGAYLFHLIQATRDEKYYHDRLLSMLPAPGEDESPYQIAETVRHMAQNGDLLARQALYSIFDTFSTNGDFGYADQLFKLDGLDGALFAIERYERQVQDKDPGDCWSLFMDIEDKLGKQEAAQAMEAHATAQPEVAAFWNRVRAQKAEANENMRSDIALKSYAEVRAAILDDTRRELGPILRWARSASEADLILAARDLSGESDDERLLAYLRIFRSKPFPLDPDPLIKLASRSNDKIKMRALIALEKVISPKVRLLATRLMRTKRWFARAPGLLAKNYRPGDEARVLSLLHRDMDADEYHLLGINVREFYEVNPVLDCTAAMLLMYEHGDCSICRHGVVEHLKREGPLPDWLEREYQFDCHGGVFANDS